MITIPKTTEKTESTEIKSNKNDNKTWNDNKTNQNKQNETKQINAKQPNKGKTKRNESKPKKQNIT